MVGLVQRSLERVVGTWIGLLLAGLLLWRYPEGLWLVAIIVVLQFTVEMLVLRNYALAAIFITAAALTLASGGMPVPDLGGFLLARGVDTAVGCAVALVVFQLTWPRASAALLPEQLTRSFTAIEAVAAQLAVGDVASDAARLARRELQHRCFALSEAFQQATSASRQPRREVERLWPAIAATEELAFRVLTSCWAVERLDEESGREAARTMFGEGGLQALREALGQAAMAVDGQLVDPPVAAIPGLLEQEMVALRRSLRNERA